MEFDPKKHICKFYFEPWGPVTSFFSYKQRITGDLYSKELKIEIFNQRDEFVEVIGYSLEPYIDVLLPMLIWDDFEKARDIQIEDLVDWPCSEHSTGYRDGWCILFHGINESGRTMITTHMDETFRSGYKPAPDKLLDWIERTFGSRREFKEYKLQW